MEFEAGKSYRVKHPNGKGKIHVDHILDNPTREGDKYKMVVYRQWIPHKQSWFWYVEPMYAMHMWAKEPFD